jgi:N-acetylglucosaminyldiphosphoundecaprenol N-acetyl-beta-D-mannosaminyltransferase
MEIVEVLGYHLIKNDLSVVPLTKKVLINTMSPNSYGLSVKDSMMHEALTKADFLVMDGLYFGLAPLLLKGQIIKRFAGWDCFRYFSSKANESHGRVLFLGSTEKTLALIRTKFREEYQNVEVETYSPPFREVFTDEDNQKMRHAINAFRPDVIFVGLTAPKQEKWGYQNKEFLDVHVICTIGNVFDWYAGNAKRPGIFWQKAGLEWLVRIFYRPEVFRRNIGNQMLFFWHLLLYVLKIKKHD